MRTLRSRLILSHILPLLLLTPLIGLVLVYLVETQVLLNTVSDDLAVQAAQTAHLAGNQPPLSHILKQGHNVQHLDIIVHVLLVINNSKLCVWQLYRPSD